MKTLLLACTMLIACAEQLADLERDERSDSPACADYVGGELSGDELLVLVNKEPAQQLQKEWSPADLVPIDPQLMIPGRSGSLRLGALTAFDELVAAARAEAALELRIRSAYRSFATQCQTFEYWVQKKGLEHAKRFSAEPGRSQHQLGTTIDISSAALNWDVSAERVEGPEYDWLSANAHRFGYALPYPEGLEELTGYGYEPWHYRYIGHQAAQEMHDARLPLESYLQACQAASDNLLCPEEAQPEVLPNSDFIGGLCEDREDCASLGPGAICLDATDGYTGGHCAIPCTQSCPDRPGANATTFCVNTEELGGLCHSRCDEELFADTGCREGYSCQSAARPDGSAGMVCLPSSS